MNVALKTLTPNLRGFEIRTGDGGWQASADKFEWAVHAGTNRLEVRTVNALGVTGPVSTAELVVKK